MFEDRRLLPVSSCHCSSESLSSQLSPGTTYSGVQYQHSSHLTNMFTHIYFKYSLKMSMNVGLNSGWTILLMRLCECVSAWEMSSAIVLSWSAQQLWLGSCHPLWGHWARLYCNTMLININTGSWPTVDVETVQTQWYNTWTLLIPGLWRMTD